MGLFGPDYEERTVPEAEKNRLESERHIKKGSGQYLGGGNWKVKVRVAKGTYGKGKPTGGGSGDIYIIKDKPSEVADNLGSFVYFWIMIAAVVVPVALFAISGVNVGVAFLFFGLFPLVGVFGGYFFKRFRTSRPARDLDKMIHNGSAIALHIGTDDKARLVDGRRGSTGRWHLPNMEIVADSIQKAIFPFYSTVVAIIHSKSEAMLNPDFLYYATMLTRNSDKIGTDGKKKQSAEIMDVVEAMLSEEREFKLIEEARIQVRDGLKTTDDLLMSKLDQNLLFPDGKTLDAKYLAEQKKKWTDLFLDDGKKIHDELERLEKGLKITIEEKNFRFEWDKDISGRVVGGHLVHDRVIDLHDFRNFLPSGGTAEDGFSASEFASMAGREEKGPTNATVLKWIFVLMGILFVGVVAYLVLTALHV